MAYVAIKPCRFGGQAFRIGEGIPAELVQPGSAKNLIKMGIIADTEPVAPLQEAPQPIDTIPIDLHTDEGDLALRITAASLQKVFDALTVSVGKAEPVIQTITEADALILLHAADSRKSIKDLVAARAKEITGEGEA